jgi:hypothetical protein
MEKVIKLGNAELKLHSSLFTIIEYRNVFGTELFSDIKKIDKLSKTKEEDFSLVINTIFKIIYILHRPFSKLDYNEFLMNLDFSVLSDMNELQNLSNAIGEMLGSVSNGGFPKDPKPR